MNDDTSIQNKEPLTAPATPAAKLPPEELQSLLKLPWSQLKELSKDKQEAVFAEIKHQIQIPPEFVDGCQTLAAALGQREQDILNELSAPQMFYHSQTALSMIEWGRGIADYTVWRLLWVCKNLSCDVQQSLQILADLSTYIKAELDEHGERYITKGILNMEQELGITHEYTQLSLNPLIIAAAGIARAAGNSIPPLLIERQMELPLLHSIIPTAHTMPNNALMNTLQQKAAINAGPFDMVVSNARGKRKEITAYTMAEINPGETDIKIVGVSLTEYERQVSDAIISLWIEATKEKLPPIFTPDMIVRAMPGGSNTVSPQQRGAITKVIEKFRRLHITVDATEEMRKRGVIRNNETFKIDNFYLSATHAEYKVKNGGQIVNAYKIDAEPIILTYCTLTKQLLTVPAKYLAITKIKKGRISNELIAMTADRQSMTGYMLRRIAIMKHDRKNKTQRQSNVILFNTLFSETETKTNDRKQTMINRNFCFNVLDYWKASGFIKGYSKQEKGRSITGIAIDF